MARKVTCGKETTVSIIRGIVHVFDPTYRINVWAVTGVSNAEFRRRMKKQASLTFDPSMSAGKFYEITRRGNEVGVIWSSDRGINLMHECAHAAFWILRKRGVGFTYEAEEAFCYEQAFLYRSITTAYRR